MAASVASAGSVDATAGWVRSMARMAVFTAPVPWPVTIRTEMVPCARSRKRNAFVRLTAWLTRSPCKSRTGSPCGGGSCDRCTLEVSHSKTTCTAWLRHDDVELLQYVKRARTLVTLPSGPFLSVRKGPLSFA